MHIITVVTVLLILLAICVFTVMGQVIGKARVVKQALLFTIINDIFCAHKTHTVFEPRDGPPPAGGDLEIISVGIDQIRRLIHAVKLGVPLSVHSSLQLMTTFEDVDNEKPLFGSLCKEKEQFWLSFRGSLDSTDIREDLMYRQTEMHPLQPGDDGIRCHAGFLKRFRQYESRLYAHLTPGATVVICGHSLGAGVGTVAAYELARLGFQVYLYAIASPRVGNVEFSQALATNKNIRRLIRLVNLSDIVPALPLAVMPNLLDTSSPHMYQHVGEMIYFDQNQLSLWQNHHITIYDSYIQLQLQIQNSS